MAGDAVRAVGHEKLPGGIPVDEGRGVRVLALELRVGDAIDLPDRAARPGVEPDHLARARLVVELHRPMDQLEIERVSLEHRGARHAELDVEPAEPLTDVELPDLLAVDGVAREDAGAEEGPHVPPVGRG